MDEAGNLKKVDELIPFSVGKRQCLGEGLAKMEIYLLIANLCNQFEVKYFKKYSANFFSFIQFMEKSRQPSDVVDKLLVPIRLFVVLG